MVSVPKALIDSTVRREGEQGRRWLEELPRLIARFVEEWECDVVGPASSGEVAIVVPVRRGDESAVLKISYPHASFDGQVGALRIFRGRSAVRLVEVNEPAGALLLERAGPDTLASLPDAGEAIEIAGGLALRLAVPAPDEAFSLARAAAVWAEQLERQIAAAPNLLPSGALGQARETIDELARDSTPTMIHGDLHVGNVLAAVREPWLTIDPLGWRGTAAFDAFTVVAGERAKQSEATNPELIRARARRYAVAAGVDAELAIACCQARATSAYLHQHLEQGDWFDPEFLRAVAVPGSGR